MTNVNAVMLQLGRISADTKRETTEDSAQQLEHLQGRREGLKQNIERAEHKVFELERKALKDDGDAAKINASAERTTAEIQRDQVKLDVVGEELQQQFDAVLKQEKVSADALRSIEELGDRTHDVIRSFA